MHIASEPELFWLTATVVMTALFWVPYIIQYISETGLRHAVWDPHGEHPLQAQWAQRAHRAHLNAVENLVVFAPLAIAIHLLGASTELTASAAMLYFVSRALHYVIYLLGAPVVRTLVFFVGWVCQLIMALTLFGVIAT